MFKKSMIVLGGAWVTGMVFGSNLITGLVLTAAGAAVLFNTIMVIIRRERI